MAGLTGACGSRCRPEGIYDEVESGQAFFTVIVETNRSHSSLPGRKLPIAPGMMTDTQIIMGARAF